VNSGRDPGDGAPGRALWHARWFRATLVFSVAALAAALTVPSVLRDEATQDDAVLAPGPPPGLGRLGGEVTTLAWNVESSPPAFASARAAAPAARRLAVVGVAAGAPAAPKSPESSAGKGAPGMKVTPAAAGSPEAYWVQIGAYRDGETARRVAQRLRDQKYQVQESIVPRAAPAPERTAADAPALTRGERDRYEVVVTGSPSEVEKQLKAKGLTSRAATEGAVVTPGLPLAEAVTLSKDLSDSGLVVRVRRIAPASGTTAGAPEGSGGESLHRVRVGGFADRAAAMTALKELEARGYKPLLTRGNE
jgi:cell division septation protein DedD